MADILLDEQSAPTTPTSGQGVLFIDSSASILCHKDDAGRVWASNKNAAVAAQGSGFAADTYVINSDLQIPSFGFQAKTTFLFTISASKTAAGVATPIYNVRIGTNRTTADTTRLTLTGPAQTAIADIGTLYIMLTVRTGGAATIIQGTAWWAHTGTAASTTVSGTGFANDSTGHIQATGASFDASAVAGQYIGISINGGASASWTLTQCIANGDW